MITALDVSKNFNYVCDIADSMIMSSNLESNQIFSLIA